MPKQVDKELMTEKWWECLDGDLNQAIQFHVKKLLQSRVVTREEIEEGLDNLIDGGMKITDTIEWLKELGIEVKDGKVNKS